MSRSGGALWPSDSVHFEERMWSATGCVCSLRAAREALLGKLLCPVRTTREALLAKFQSLSSRAGFSSGQVTIIFRAAGELILDNYLSPLRSARKELLAVSLSPLRAARVVLMAK